MPTFTSVAFAETPGPGQAQRQQYHGCQVDHRRRAVLGRLSQTLLQLLAAWTEQTCAVAGKGSPAVDTGSVHELFGELFAEAAVEGPQDRHGQIGQGAQKTCQRSP